MKINVSFLAALLLVGTGLVARAAMQGVELALVLTAFEYSCSWAKRLSRWARAPFIDEVNHQPDLIWKATVKFAINVFFSLYLSAVNCRFRAKGMAMTFWQLIFIQSKVNGGGYNGDRLPTQNWKWPKETWFQTRVREQCRTRSPSSV